MSHIHLVRDYSMIPAGPGCVSDMCLTVEILKRNTGDRFKGYGRVKTDSAGKIYDFSGEYSSIEEALSFMRGEALLKFPDYYILTACHSDTISQGSVEVW